MRTIKGIANIPKEVSPAHPDGAIVNESTPGTGTPVVREVYQDVLSNIYAILRAAGITPNESEDSELTSYQLLSALQKLANTYNDIEQNLSSTGTIFSVALEIESRPDKYFLIAKAVTGYNPDTVYSFKGTGSTVYGFSSPTGFSQGDEVLIILDRSGVRAYRMSALGGGNQTSEVFPVLGTLLAFNNSKKLWYQSEGVLFADAPERYDLQSAIQIFESDASILVYEMLAIGAFIICVAFRPANRLYKLYKFDANNLATAPVALNVPGLPAPGATDRQPYFFTDGTLLYVSNNAGSVATDNVLAKYSMNLSTGVLTQAGTVTLDNTYRKTSNSVIVGAKLYTLISGFIEQYDLNSGQKANGITLPGNIGNLVVFAGSVYFCGVDAAKKWSLPIY